MTQESKLPIPFNDLAHVIRTPLTVIKTQISLSKSKAKAKDNPELIELASTVSDQVELISSILDDISLITNSEAGSLKRGNDVVDIAALATEIVASQKEQLTQDRINLELDIHTASTIAADKEHITRILRRLISNSVLDGATSVTLTIESDAIKIKDNGLGTSADQAELNSKTPRYSRRSSVGLMAIRILCRLYDYKMEVVARPDGSKIELRRL